MIDQPAEQKHNEDQFFEALQLIDPELYKIKVYLDQYHVNPVFLPRIIRAIGNLNVGTGYGDVLILVKERTVTQVKTNESDVINLPVERTI